MSAFALYLVGTLVLIAGLAYGASLAGAPTEWIIAGAVVFLGLGIVTAVTRTRVDGPR